MSGNTIKPLSEITKDELANNRVLTERLLTFAILTKKMYYDTGKLIDTRPEEVGRHPLEWFRQTSNILADTETGETRFVDTRWLWDANTVIGKKGVNLIERLGIKSIDRAIREYISLLNEERQ